ncbi:MAG: head GIN domain-containing protein [Cyclobacteriaceae bacterium]|jgi:hypothetical protein
MKRIIFLGLILGLLLSSCREEDFGPLQNAQRNFTELDFDRLLIQDALDVTVRRGNYFSVQADGDSRNLNDLLVYKSGGTLVVKYESSERRQYQTRITIVMPELKGIDLAGATIGRVNDFTGMPRFDVTLSGASYLQAQVAATDLVANVSAASHLVLRGSGENLQATLSGASQFSGFDYPVEVASLNFSGASLGKVSSSQRLQIAASGASIITYRGNPQLVLDVTGSSVVRAE